MQPAVHQLGDLGYILQAGAGADEGADADVEAVVGEEGEGEGGRVGGGGGDEGHGQRAGEADDGDGEGDGQDGGEGGGVVEGDFRFEGEGYKVGEVEVHAGLEAGVVGVVVDDRVDAAVAEDGELVAEGDFGDGDGGEEGRFRGPVEEGREGGEDGGVGVRVAAELGDGLGGEHVEPVEGLGLVGVNVVVSFCKDGGRGWRGGSPQDARCGAGAMAGGGAGGGGGGGPVAAGEGARGGGGFGRGGVAEDEEFDEAGDEDHDGELAEEEALGEG